MENINKIQIVPDEVYEIGADKAPVIPEWSVKDDATLWQKVNKLAHSTFDLSKFTVVGSPIITEDGIASGFSSSNYVQSTISATPTKSIILRGKGVYSSTPNTANGAQVLVQTIGTNSNPSIEYNPNQHSLSAVRFHSGGDSLIQSAIIDITLNDGDIVETEVIATSTYVTINAKINGVAYTNTWSGNGLYCGAISATRASINNNYYWTGSIDLKQFSITVDGVEVFSGNKTGVDTIKPDDYQVVGAPTISTDGVASGFSASNYLSKQINYFGDKAWQIKLAFTTSNNITTEQGFFGNSTSWDNGLSLKVQNGNLSSVWLVNNGTLYAIYDGIVLSNIQTNTKYYVILEYDGVEYYNIYTSTDNINFTRNIHVSSNLEIETTLTTWKLGYVRDNTPFTGSIDLNAFKIYVDGNLVYQPCLKIPYTEGQNYVKIVDKLYRDRIKDLFEQKGYNGYYTIGEDDFTLPSNKWSDVIEHKENGLTVAEQRVDQTLTIRGACEQGVDVNLPMEFFSADSYAVFGVGTTGTNTASKFTPAADGNYIAIGKGKV